MKKVIIVLGILLTLAGCKPQVPAQQTQDEQAKLEDAVPAGNVDPGQETPTDGRDVADKPAEGKPQYVVNLRSEAFPELHPDVSTVDRPWGKMERKTLKWHEDIEICYEIPVFSENSPAFNKINHYLREKSDQFFSKESLSEVWGYEYGRHSADDSKAPLNDKYYYYNTADVTEISDRFVSVTSNMEWYMGGVSDVGTTAYTFDAGTGEILKLADLYHKSAAEMHDIVKKGIETYLEQNDLSPATIEWDLFEKIQDYSYYIKDGIPVVTFKKYEIAVGAAGAFDIALSKLQ